MNPSDIALFLRQFSTLITAGIPILQCLTILEKSQRKIPMRLLIYSIKRELLSGKNLHSILQNHGKYFNAFTCQLIKIGEHTGKLDQTLQMIADEHEKQIAFIKRIKHALLYPCIITLTAFIITISLFLFVIPHFAELFAGTNISLPLLTRGLFFLSAELNQHIYLLLLPLICLPLIFKKPGIERIRRLHILKKIHLARFARNLAMTYSAGIPISDALKLLTQSHSHHEFTQTLIHLRSKLHSGLTLHHAMQGTFPDLMLQMVRIGEESGKLDDMLNKTADFFEAEIDRMTTQFIRLLEPLIMLILGALIGGLIIAMYLPIFKLGSAL